MSKIFGEEHFFDQEMVNIIEERGNAIDNAIFDEILGIAKIELPPPKIILNREKVKKWLILCGQLENIEHSELIDMATKKKFADKDAEIEELRKENFKLRNLKSRKNNEKQMDVAKQIIEKVKSYFALPDGYESFANYCEDDITISESDFMEFLDKLLEEYKGDKNG